MIQDKLLVFSKLPFGLSQYRGGLGDQAWPVLRLITNVSHDFATRGLSCMQHWRKEMHIHASYNGEDARTPCILLLATPDSDLSTLVSLPQHRGCMTAGPVPAASHCNNK